MIMPLHVKKELLGLLCVELVTMMTMTTDNS